VSETESSTMLMILVLALFAGVMLLGITDGMPA
jgi:hypothetical protein